MASRLLVASLVLSSLVSSGAALAQGAAKPDTKAGAAPAPAASAAPMPPPAGPLKDPENKKGISPYMEAVKKGEDSFVARDFTGAVAAFQDAVKLDSTKMLGFYRLGEAQLAAGKPEEAEAVWTVALGKDGPADLKSKVLFVIADLRERQKKLDVAKEEWSKYATFLKEHASDAKGYAGTPEERTKVIERRLKDEKDYAAVKERIKKREEERQKEAEENAKKDKNNK
jgi:TolA-binding protein